MARDARWPVVVDGRDPRDPCEGRRRLEPVAVWARLDRFGVPSDLRDLADRSGVLGGRLVRLKDE